METPWVKNRSSWFVPEISVIGQLKIAEAESWHEESTGGADLLSVRGNAGIGRVKLPEIGICRRQGIAMKISNQWLLQSRGNQPNSYRVM